MDRILGYELSGEVSITSGATNNMHYTNTDNPIDFPMTKEVYFIEFESKYWHGASDEYTTLLAETEDEARYLAEPIMEKRLADLGYENDPGHITRVACLN